WQACPRTDGDLWSYPTWVTTDAVHARRPRANERGDDMGCADTPSLPSRAPCDPPNQRERGDHAETHPTLPTPLPPRARADGLLRTARVRAGHRRQRHRRVRHELRWHHRRARASRGPVGGRHARGARRDDGRRSEERRVGYEWRYGMVWRTL